MSHFLAGRRCTLLLYMLLALALAGCSAANPSSAPNSGRPTAAPAAAARPTATAAALSQPAAAPSGPYKVLFDASHAETAGNADWVISTGQPDPLRENASPRGEADWTGAISAWGVALQRTGRYTLMTIPRDGRITYGDSANSLDLGSFDVFVVPEPNTRFSAGEKTAIMSFVQNGGGLFMIADHDKSDRNNDGIDALAIWNDLMSSNSVNSNDPFGFSFDKLNIGTDNPRGIPPGAADSPVIHGPFGDVTGSIIRNGTTATIRPDHNPNVQGILYRSRADTNGTTGVFFVTSGFGRGRVAAWGDSSPIDDGTGAPGEQLFDGWDDAGGSDAILALNATEWLAQGRASPPDATPAPTVAPQPTAIAPGGGQQLIVNGDFERGTEGWRASSSDGRPLVSGQRAHGGKQAAVLCGANNCKASLAQTLDIPAGARTVTLNYYVYIDTQETNHAFDFLDVEIRDVGGKKLKALQRMSDGDPAGEWRPMSADLSEFAGRTVQLVFTATSGKTKPTAFFVDDVSVSVE